MLSKTSAKLRKLTGVSEEREPSRLRCLIGSHYHLRAEKALCSEPRGY